MLSLQTSLMLLASMATPSFAHGYLKMVESAAGVNDAPAPWDNYQKLPQTASRIGYNSNKEGTYCLFPQNFNDPSAMSCGPSSKNPAPNTIEVKAGSSVTMAWAGSTGELKSFSRAPNGFFPFVHAMGPVVDYLAECTNGDCTKFDATGARWTKVAEYGLDKSETMSQELRGLMGAKPEVTHPISGPGIWGMSKMIEDGSKWTLNVPSNLRPGQYLWRNELGAIHSSPAQIYIVCTQLTVTGSGSTSLPAGVTGDKLYTADSDYGSYNVYTDNGNNFIVPGGPVWSGAGASSNTSTSVPDDTTPVVSVVAQAPAVTPAAQKPTVPTPSYTKPKTCKRKRSHTIR